MKRIDRYIFDEILTPTLIALFALTAVLVGRQISALLELIVRWSPTPSEFWNLLTALIPPALTFTIPTGVLVGVLTGFGRMSSDSESVAFRAAGLSTGAIIRPVLVLGVLAWTLNFVLAVWIAPSAVTRLRVLTEEVAARQMALQLQPRVFNEDLDGRVLLVDDVSPDGRDWRGVFLANTTPEQREVIVAESGRLIGDASSGRYELTLSNGSTYVVSRSTPNRDADSRFTSYSLPIPIASPAPDTPSAEDLTIEAPTRELWNRVRTQAATYSERVEFHRRLALPFAAIAFAWIGFPLGLSTDRGGRSMGLVISAVLMLAYYMLFIGGTRIAGNSQMSPFIGTWGANLAFTMLGTALMFRSRNERRNRVLDWVLDGYESMRRRLRPANGTAGNTSRWAHILGPHSKWFRTLDVYVLRTFCFYFSLVMAVFTSLFIVVTLFELLSDIVKNDVPVGVIAGYFFYLLPQIFYWVSPLAVLVAVLVSLGTLTKSNETLAVTAGAVSLYRLTVPLLLVACLLSAGTYVLQDFLLPHTNRLQDSFRNTIKGRAPQSYQNPPRKWMMGANGRVYYYSYFDPDLNEFYELEAFARDPSTFALREWTFASRATWNGRNWVLENGWRRSTGEEGADLYTTFETMSFTAMNEPPEYFMKEVRIASQMTYPELRSYIEELGTSGFDVTSLTVDLYRKLSFPLVSVIMAMIAIPFSFTTGRRGAFYGVGIAIVIGIGYWGALEIFDKLGGISQISPVIAAWFPNLIFGFSGFWMLLRVRT